MHRLNWSNHRQRQFSLLAEAIVSHFQFTIYFCSWCSTFSQHCYNCWCCWCCCYCSQHYGLGMSCSCSRSCRGPGCSPYSSLTPPASWGSGRWTSESLHCQLLREAWRRSRGPGWCGPDSWCPGRTPRIWRGWCSPSRSGSSAPPHPSGIGQSSGGGN